MQARAWQGSPRTPDRQSDIVILFCPPTTYLLLFFFFFFLSSFSGSATSRPFIRSFSSFLTLATEH